MVREFTETTYFVVAKPFKSMGQYFPIGRVFQGLQAKRLKMKVWEGKAFAYAEDDLDGINERIQYFKDKYGMDITTIPGNTFPSEPGGGDPGGGETEPEPEQETEAPKARAASAPAQPKPTGTTTTAKKTTTTTIKK